MVHGAACLSHNPQYRHLTVVCFDDSCHSGRFALKKLLYLCFSVSNPMRFPIMQGKQWAKEKAEEEVSPQSHREHAT